MTSSATGRHAATFWLLLWTVNNIGVTLINKAIFSVVSFPYPYTLTAIHMLCAVIGCRYIFYSIQTSASPKTNIWVQMLGDQLLLSSQSTTKDSTSHWIMICFSILFTLNIAIGNVSLHHVSVNFNQVMRSLVPIITLWCSLVLNKPISRARRMAVWPVVAGVALACYGDRMSVSVIGFGYTLLCVILASVKVVASSELLTGVRQMHPVELLDRMAPLALLQCCLLAFGAGEVQSLKNRPDLNPIVTGDWKPVFLLLFSGFVAFSLNICALQAYKLTSALTCCIAAAVKQVLMIVVGTILFDTPVTLPNGVGIAVVILASTYYSYVSIQEQQVSTQKQEEDGCEDLESGNPDDKALMTSPDDKRGMVRR